MAVLMASCSPNATSSPSSDALPAATVENADAFKQPVVYAEDGLALKGADPVAYFTDSAYVQGDAAYSHEWNGATWHFASAENRDLFAGEPEKYAPQYGGYCAWAVSQGNTAAVDPEAWEIVDGKLYLNYNQKVKDRWAADIPGNIEKAEQNWPRVLNN